MMQAEPGIPQSCSIFSGRAPQPPRPSRRWGAGAALVVLVAVLGIATPEDAQAQDAPGMPRNFVTSASDTQAGLQWQAPTNPSGAPITKYEYRYAEEAATYPTTWDFISTGGQEREFWGAVVSGLTNGTRYAFQVRAVNSVGAGPEDTKSATVSVTPPPSPVGPEITLSWGAREAGLEPSSFTLTITFSEEVDGFEINDINIITNSDSDGNGIQSGGEKADFQTILAKTTYSVEVTPVPALGHSAQAVSVFIFRNRVHTVDGGTPNEQKVQLINLTGAGTGTGASTDATLSALTLEDASNDFSIALSPPFASGTMSYMASVDNDVDEITIKPTVNESNATFEYQDSSNTKITDANSVKAGQQVSLSEGANTIKVKVTAQDDTTTDAYTVVVTRGQGGTTPITSTNTAPTVATAISDQTATVGTALLYAFPANTFADTDAGDTLTYTATQSNNSALPAWLSFAAATRTFSGTPQVADVGTVSVTVTASDGNGGSVSDTFDIVVSAAASTNTPATGAPTISGTAALGQQLTASTMGISDADGLPSSFSYQWVRVAADGTSNPVDISGATTATYTLTTAEVGRRVKVRVSFTDNDNNSEMLTSAAYPSSGAVTAPATAACAVPSLSGRNVIWTGTMTVAVHPTNAGVFGFQSGSFGTLDDQTFTVGANGYTTRRVSLMGDDLTFATTTSDLTAGDKAKLRLHVCATALNFSAATGPVDNAYLFSTTGLSWSSADTVTLRLSVPAETVIQPPPTPVVALGRRSSPSTPPPPPPPGDVVGFLENPGATSFQSGIGVISGWTCDADEVEITLNGEPQEAAYGTERLDTLEMCGDTANGFGLLFNWNLLGDGEHEVVALVDGVELDRATVTVTTLGAEFLRDVTGTCTAADFPTEDETVTLAWQQTQQNFVIAEGAAPAGTTNRTGTPGMGYLENPGPNSFQSGIGVLSGWACEGEEVVIELNGAPQPAAYGTERLDTEEACGDTANGFGLLFNWNLLGEGEHEVVAYVDGEELGRATVRVTTLGAEFVRGVTGECMVEDFPMLGETVTLEWQQNSQNFVVTDVEGGSTL